MVQITKVRSHLTSNYIACLRSADSVRNLADYLSQLSFVPLSLNLHLLGGWTGINELTGSVWCTLTMWIQDFGNLISACHTWKESFHAGCLQISVALGAYAVGDLSRKAPKLTCPKGTWEQLVNVFPSFCTGHRRALPVGWGSGSLNSVFFSISTVLCPCDAGIRQS